MKQVTLMEVKAWPYSNFHMKGMFEASYVLGVELHREYFEIFSMENSKLVKIP